MKTLFSLCLVGLIVAPLLPLASSQTIPTIKPGVLPDCMGQSFRQNQTFDIVNSTGFQRIHYMYYGHILVYDYLLKPGRNATMIYAEHGGPSSDIEGNFQFLHDNRDESHSGINIQTSMINATADSAYSKIMVLADKDTKQGTYWLVFPPGLCSGGNVILFTIGDSIELEPQIGSIKAHIENHGTDNVIVINSSPYILTNLTISDPVGKIERAYEIMVDPDGNSARWFTPTQNGNYTVILTNAINNMTMYFAVSGLDEPKQNVTQNSNNNLIAISPLKQFQSGIPVQDVKCNQGLQLIFKAEDLSPACVKPNTVQKLTERGWAWNYANVVGKESISLSAYQGVSNEAFYNNGTVTSNFTINVNIDNFRPSNSSLLLQVYYNDGTLYKTFSIPSNMIQPDGYYKYQLTAVSDKNHPVPFKVVATYINETAIAYAPVFAHP